jgi:hypothetical protein
MHIFWHLLITYWLLASLLGVLHPGPSLSNAAGRQSLNWLGQVLSGLCGGGTYDPTPHRAVLSSDPLYTGFLCLEHTMQLYI